MFLPNRCLYILPIVAAIFFTGCKKDDNNDDDDDQPDEQIILAPCDNGIALDDTLAMNAVKAIELCKTTSAGNDEWGVISARYIRANGTDAAHSAQIGIMSAFGNKVTPQRGERLLVLSTGAARTITQPSACGSNSCQTTSGTIAPAGFPQQVSGCPTPATTIYDDIGLEINLRAPKSAKGFSIDFMYFTFEYPNFVCTSYNDQFIIRMNAAPSGAVNGNIAMEGQNNNPITVNAPFISTANDSLLDGTGFGHWGDAGCTGWLRTSAPVEGGQEFTLQFIIFDTGDGQIDATVVLDNFRWMTETPALETKKL